MRIVKTQFSFFIFIEKTFEMANINIIGIYDQNNQDILTTPLTLQAKENTQIIRVRFSIERNYWRNQTLRVGSYDFGEILSTKTHIFALQGNVAIVDCVFELWYPTNASVMLKTWDFNYFIESEDQIINFSTLNNQDYKLTFKQATSVTIESAQLGNYEPELTRYLEERGLIQGKVFLGTIYGLQVSDVFLTTDAPDFGLGFTVEKEERVYPLSNIFHIYLTDYKPNYSSEWRGVKFTINGVSTATGKTVKYYDNNLYFRQNGSNVNPDLLFNIDTYNYNYKEQIIEGSISYNNQTTQLDNIIGSPWLNIRTVGSSTDGNITTALLEMNMDRNNLEGERYMEIVVYSNYEVEEGDSDYESKENRIPIYQAPEPNKTNTTTCNDMWCSFAATELTEFALCDDETDIEIFRGYAYPIDGIVNINIKDIVDNYVKNDIQFLEVESPKVKGSFCKYYSDPHSSKTFYVKVGNEIIQTFHIVQNWSFEDNVVEKIKNKPYLQQNIQGIVDDRQYVFMSRYHFNKINGLRDEDILVMEIQFAQNPELSFISPLITQTTKINNISGKIPHTGTEASNKRQLKNLTYKVNSEVVESFDICWDKCHKYCLYYINKYGGVDWFLFGKTSKESRQITNESSTFGDKKKNYSRKINRKWSLKTEYLKDYQSKLMENIFESPKIYLHDLESDEIVEVNIGDTSYDIKTLGNNGRKFYLYNINVEEQKERKIIG